MARSILRALDELADRALAERRTPPEISTDRATAQHLANMMAEEIGNADFYGKKSAGQHDDAGQWFELFATYNGIRIVAPVKKQCQHEVD